MKNLITIIKMLVGKKYDANKKLGLVEKIYPPINKDKFLELTGEALEMINKDQFPRNFIETLQECKECCGKFIGDINQIISDTQQAFYWSDRAQEFVDNMCSKYSPGGWPDYDILDNRERKSRKYTQRAMNSFVVLCEKIKKFE